MCRSQRVMDDDEAQRISDAAVRCLAERGFAGTTIRALAAAAEVPVGRIYEHHRSKQALLGEIAGAAHDARLAQTLAAIEEADGDPVARLEAVIWAHSDFHARHAAVSRVAQAEVRHLAPATQARIAALRDREHAILAEIVADGIERGAFAPADPDTLASSLVAMCASVASWFDPEAQTPRRIARTMCELALRMTSAHGAGVASGARMAVPAAA